MIPGRDERRTCGRGTTHSPRAAWSRAWLPRAAAWAPRIAAGILVVGLSGAVRAEAPDALTAAIERASRRDYRGALASIDTAPAVTRATARSLYLRARVETNAGLLSAAAESYGRALEAGLPASLVDETRLDRALLLARSGRCADALPLLASLRARRDRIGALARASEAECTLEVGDASEAARLLAAVVDEDAGVVDRVAARLALVTAYERTNATARAVALLRETYVADPLHRDASTVEARLRALAPDALVLTRDESVARVKKLLDGGAPQRALGELDALGRPHGRRELAAHLHLRGTILLALRTRPMDAHAVFVEASRLGGESASEDEFLAARALSRADRDAEAIAAYDRFVRAHPADPRAEDAAFAAALLAVRGRGGGDGAHRLERFLARRPEPSREHRVEAERRLALDALAHRKANAALAHLARFRALEPDADEMADYFTARVAELKGDARSARAQDRALATRRPYSYYGLLAMQRLALAGETTTLPPIARGARAAPSIELPDDVAFLSSLGLREEASERLRAAESRVRALAPQGAEREALIVAYTRIGDSARAYNAARGLAADVGRPGVDVPGFVVDALFPRPFVEEVRAAIAPFPHVPEAYVYATMRQESGYAPGARSHVGAIGLLQLMPSTGARVASSYGMTFDAEMLFDPVVNVRLGVGEMERLCARFPALALVAAAYNAGEGRVVAWLGDTREVDLDRFVESIPFDETRRYVKRVLSYQAVYESLAGDGSRGLAAVPLRVSWNH